MELTAQQKKDARKRLQDFYRGESPEWCTSSAAGAATGLSAHTAGMLLATMARKYPDFLVERGAPDSNFYRYKTRRRGAGKPLDNLGPHNTADPSCQGILGSVDQFSREYPARTAEMAKLTGLSVTTLGHHARFLFAKGLLGRDEYPPHAGKGRCGYAYYPVPDEETAPQVPPPAAPQMPESTEYVIQFRARYAPADGIWTDLSVKPLPWPEDQLRQYLDRLRASDAMGADYRVWRRQVRAELLDW